LRATFSDLSKTANAFSKISLPEASSKSPIVAILLAVSKFATYLPVDDVRVPKHLFQTPLVDAQGGKDDCADASPIHAMPNTSAMLAIKAFRIDIVAPTPEYPSLFCTHQPKKPQG